METRWLYTNSKDFATLREASEKTCIIPIGSVEKHGLHLPLGTDIITASVISHMASQIETVTVAPDFWFGDVSGAQPDGGMTFFTDITMEILENLCDQIGAQGYEKILLYNGHGGNITWLHLFQKRLENKKKPYVIIRTEVACTASSTIPELITKKGNEFVPELTDSDCKYLMDFYNEKKLVGHACLDETAYMLAISPENVHLDNLGAESGKSTDAAKYLNDNGLLLADGGWKFDYPNFYQADDPDGCTETIGKAALRVAAEVLAKQIKILKDDENVLKWHKERIAGLK